MEGKAPRLSGAPFLWFHRTSRRFGALGISGCRRTRTLIRPPPCYPGRCLSYC